MDELTIPQAANKLGISERTVRRRLATGELKGSQQASPGGYKWAVWTETETPTESPQDSHREGSAKVVEVLETQVIELQRQLEAREREVQELHIMLQTAQTALAAPKEGTRSAWWKFWE